MKKQNKKTIVRIVKLNGTDDYVIVEREWQWHGTFASEEEATTYALRDGADEVVGTLGDVLKKESNPLKRFTNFQHDSDGFAEANQ